MKPFENETDDGNEKAIRRGRVVPDGAVNLAWAKAPKLSPDKNIVVVDTSRVVEENTIESSGSRKVMYANSLGVLEDKYGNQIVDDEFPVVSDTFAVDEDWSTIPGDEYTDEDVLPFVHRSRYFHVDWAGLVLNNDLYEYRTDAIKVVDAKGREYVDSDNKPRFKIKITTAFGQPDDEGEFRDQCAYRVYAFIDSEENEELYLLYNKIEVDGVDGDFKDHELNYKELLNPLSYYDYTPEESEVVDLANREKKIYSTKLISMKQQILDEPVQGKDGYRVFVPKKAIGDPRIFQLFRWRVSCSYTQSFKVDPNSGTGVRAGIIVTNAQPASRAPYAFLNLSRSQYNATQVNFYNPLTVIGDGINTEKAKETAAYWHVNLDTVSQEDLAKFDILLWSPQSRDLPMLAYWGKLDYFTNTKGGLLFVDTNSYSAGNFYTLQSTTPVVPNGFPRYDAAPHGYADLAQTFPVTNDVLFDGDAQLGGWDFNDGTGDEYATLSAIRSVHEDKIHYMQGVPTGWRAVARARAITGPLAGQNAPIISRIELGRGGIIFSNAGIAMSTSWLFHHATGAVVSENRGASIAPLQDYRLYINASVIEGAMKFLFNASMLATRGRVLDDTDEQTYSSSWTFSTNWKSSWVIAAGDDVLSEKEIQDNDFVFLPKDINDPVPVWQRKLLYGDKSKTMRELMDSVLSPDMKQRIAGAQRKYVIEVTNSNVEVPTTLGDNSFPYAWTEAFTPKFTVPVELGPHVIRAEDLKARFDAGQYMHRTYPAKPFSGQVRSTHFDTEEFNAVQTVNWTATGTATETITTGTYTPPSSSVSEQEISWNEEGSNVSVPSPWIQEFQAPQAYGISTWQNWNYKNSAWGPGILNWPHYGLYGRWSVGSRGEVVSFIQDAMNLYQFLGFFSFGAGLAVDGYYGSRTAAAVTAFQSTFQARYIDGVVDAETASIIGSQALRAEYVIRISRPSTGFYRFYYFAFNDIKKSRISDGTKGNWYMKRSWLTGGPSIIWEMYMINFSQKYNIHGVSFTPRVEGNTPTSMFRSIDVRSQPFNLINYNSQTGSPIYMPHRPRDGETIYVPFNPRYGDTLIIGQGQDGGTGHGSSRMLGVRDITAHARVTTTIPGVNTIRKYVNTIPIQCSGTAFITSRNDVVIVLQPKGYSGSGVLTNFKWTNFTLSNPSVTGELVQYGSAMLLIMKSALTSTASTTSIVAGPKIPGGSFYWMNPQKVRSGLPETGYISKTDGIKILCKADKTPYGFPALLPTNIGPNEAQRHYAKFSLVTYANDATVQMGFYDVSKKEFIVNVNGEPEMTYIEYLQRGPHNIYVAVISTYESNTQKALPNGDDSPPIPFKWAMPVYGMYRRNGSRIALEPLPSNLGSEDVWPIGVRTGRFSRTQILRSKTQGPLTNYLSDYQGTKVQAFYGIPESEGAGWSALYGPPNSDVRDEEPIIVDDDVIQVRQAPILAIEVPTGSPSMADPIRPVFEVYHRETRSDPWVEIPLHEIKDYNLSTGEIHLAAPMDEVDPALWKVTYTTARRMYQFKEYNGAVLNLNPYLPYSKQFIGKSIYVYIVPEYVKDYNGSTIADSVVDKALRFTLTPTVFDPLSPDYDPLAIQLGVVYLSTALDIKDLTILDTRRRGGGAKDEANIEEIVRLVSEASNYWDVSYGSGLSYQKGGFVIVRLPAELKARFTEPQIVEVIERNITAGVRFKIEDLEGRDWDAPYEVTA